VWPWSELEISLGTLGTLVTHWHGDSLGHLCDDIPTFLYWLSLAFFVENVLADLLVLVLALVADNLSANLSWNGPTLNIWYAKASLPRHQLTLCVLDLLAVLLVLHLHAFSEGNRLAFSCETMIPIFLVIARLNLLHVTLKPFPLETLLPLYFLAFPLLLDNALLFLNFLAVPILDSVTVVLSHVLTLLIRYNVAVLFHLRLTLSFIMSLAHSLSLVLIHFLVDHSAGRWSSFAKHCSCPVLIFVTSIACCTHVCRIMFIEQCAKFSNPNGLKT